MIKKLPSSVFKSSKTIKKIFYTLLSSKHIENEKHKFFGQQQKTILLKSKFFMKEMKYTIFQGLRELKSDTKWLIQVTKYKKKQQLTGYQIIKRRRVISDLLKFIPYSVIIAIPLAEVFLPLILWLSPNAIPSFFIFDTTHQQKVKRLETIQQESHQVLYQQFSNILKKIQISQDAFLEYDQIKKDFSQIASKLQIYYDYRKFNSDELIKVLQFLGGNYYQGTTSINKIVNLFTGTIPRICYKVYRYIYYKNQEKQDPPDEDPFFVRQNFQKLKFNYHPFEQIKRRFLLWQIQKKFLRIQIQDIAFCKNGTEDLLGDRIKCIVRQRGLPVLSCYQSLSRIFTNQWIHMRSDPILKDRNCRLIYSIMLYKVPELNLKKKN